MKDVSTLVCLTILLSSIVTNHIILYMYRTKNVKRKAQIYEVFRRISKRAKSEKSKTKEKG